MVTATDIIETTLDDPTLGQDVRTWRVLAHQEFDRLWKGPLRKFTRAAAYYHLRKEMGLSREACHIALFSVESCQEAIRVSRELWDRYRDQTGVVGLAYAREHHTMES